MPDYKVIAYIDGHNLYHGLRESKWARYYWLNLKEMAKRFLSPVQTLVHTKYFTTVVPSPQDRRRRHVTYIDALKTLSDLTIYYGHFLMTPEICRKCGHSRSVPHEKMTDVNIAVELMADAFQDSFDTALLISADSDLVPPVRAVKRLFPTKRIVVAFPPKRYSAELAKEAYVVLRLTANVLRASMLPDPVLTPSGVELRCPASWK